MATSSLEYSLNLTPGEPPTGSQVRLNSTDPVAATLVWARDSTLPGLDARALWLGLRVGDQVLIQEYDDATVAHVWTVTGPPVGKSGYSEVPVAWRQGAGVLPAQKVLVVLVAAEVPGLPPGGNTGDVLTKATATDYDAGWGPVPAGTPAGTALTTVGDVAALYGAPLAADDTRVTRLIELASAVVAQACVPLPAPVPDTVSLVTAQMVVNQLANPTNVASEGIAGYQVRYPTGPMTLSDEARFALGPWLKPLPGQAVYSVPLGAPLMPTWPVDWWQRDYDTVGDWA